jgi:hypothetical protein
MVFTVSITMAGSTTAAFTTAAFTEAEGERQAACPQTRWLADDIGHRDRGKAALSWRVSMMEMALLALAEEVID